MEDGKQEEEEEVERDARDEGRGGVWMRTGLRWMRHEVGGGG